MDIKSLLTGLVSCTLAACIVAQDEQYIDEQETNDMALSTNYLTPVVDPNSLVPGDPAAKIYEIQSGSATNKNDIDSNNQRFENKIATLDDIKLNVSGGTMTGPLVVTPTVPSNAITGNGNGIGAGLVGVGGASGPGLVAGSITLPTATVPTKGAEISGFLQISGTQPNSNVDPGSNNALHGANIVKAWVVLDTLYAVLDGYNIATITNIAGAVYRLDFVRPMANANYGVTIQQHGAPGGSGAHNGTKDVNGFRFTLYDTTDKSLGFAAGCTEAYIEVVGRQ